MSNSTKFYRRANREKRRQRAELRAIAARIPTPEALEAALSGLSHGERVTMTNALRPFLRFQVTNV